MISLSLTGAADGPPLFVRLLLPALSLLLCSLCAGAHAQDDLPSGGTPVVAADALLKTEVSGLERTESRSEVLAVTGQPFDRALRVTIGKSAPDSNVTQQTLLNAAAVQKGDSLLASFYVRGAQVNGTPAQMMLLFEKRVDPWTKSVSFGVTTARDRAAWKRVVVPFTAAESYAPGEAMVSLRFAFGPQTIEVGGLNVVNYGQSKTTAELVTLAAEKNPLGSPTVAVNLSDRKQSLLGLGGNFCQPRYGHTVPMDPVGQYNLDHLNVVHARVGLPLNYWTPERGVYKEDAQAKAALEAMQILAKRKIPLTVSVWEGPLWMLPGTANKGRPLPHENYETCIESIGKFLTLARDKYGAHADYFSFNEPDYGVNFKFSPAEMADFIRMAGPRFAALGLKTKFLTADTANGSNFADYARPLLEDKSIAAYLGPLAFHSWDALSVPEAKYRAIAELGRTYKKPVWCMEAGHDAGLWRQPNPWASWENGLRTALAYERTLRLTESELMAYWTYQENYTLVSKDGTTPFPVWHVMKQMEDALKPGWRVATATASHDELRVLPVAGPTAGQFSVMLINPIGPGKATLTGLPAGTAVTIRTSDAAAQNKTVPGEHRVDAGGKLTVELPTRSVVTILTR